MKKKIQNFITQKHYKMLKACLLINMIAFAFTCISLLPLYEGEPIAIKSYAILLTALAIIEAVSVTLISTALDRSTDKPEELEKK